MSKAVYLVLGLLAVTGCSTDSGTGTKDAPISTTAAQVLGTSTTTAPTDASPAHIPTYVCDEAVVIQPLGYKQGDTVVITGRGNCRSTEGVVGQDNTMRGPWRIAQRTPTPITYDCGKRFPAIIGPDGKPVQFLGISGNIAEAPDYVNGYDCTP